jgi:hypothetical protein
VRLCLATNAVANKPAAARSLSKDEDNRDKMAASLACSRGDRVFEAPAEHPDMLASTLRRVSGGISQRRGNSTQKSCRIRKMAQIKAAMLVFRPNPRPV